MAFKRLGIILIIMILVACGDPKVKNYEKYVTEQLPMAKISLIKARKAYDELKKANGPKQEYLLNNSVLPLLRKFIKDLQKIENPSEEVRDFNEDAIEKTKGIIKSLKEWQKVLDRPSTDNILKARSNVEREMKKLKAWENELSELALQRKITVPKDWIPGER